VDSRDSIKWCNDRIDSARDTLTSIASGSRFFVNGIDITSNVRAKAIATLEAMAGLIAAYLRLPK
jgi:hypothetical protein